MRDPDLGRLAQVMAALRAGCPWDREQTLETLRHYLVEETYEVLEVMTGADTGAHCEELGDLLFQVVFQSQIRSESGAFELADVVDGIADKLVSRHPHVFGGETVESRDQVVRRWDEIKRAEGKPQGPGGVSERFPALVRAEKVGARAAKVGFDWPDVAGPIAKVREELAEVEEILGTPTISEPAADARSVEAKAARQARLHAELGDLLFAVVNVARHLGVRPELALDDATTRFVRRFGHVEAALAADGARIEDTVPSELDRRWEAAKDALGG